MRELVGNWQVDIVRRRSDGSMMKGAGNAEIRELTMDRGINVQALLFITGIGNIHVDAFCGYDPWIQKLHLYVVGSGGILRDYVGEARSEMEHVFKWEGRHKEKIAADSLSTRFVSSNEIDVHQLHRIQDEKEEFLLYKLKRK